MKIKLCSQFLLFFCLALAAGSVRSEPIFHEKYYPSGTGPFPVIVALHTSGGFLTIKHLIQRYVDNGFAVYAPNFFKRHGLTPKTRMKTFSIYREKIESELSEILKIAKTDPRVDSKNSFAVGFSNGGFWVCYLTGTSQVNAGVAHYGVWKANFGRSFTNPYPMNYFSKHSSPILALHGNDDNTQKMKFVSKAWEKTRDNGANLETHIYPGADHAWDRKNSNRWPYNEEVDTDAHKRTLKFFRKHMK